MQLEQLRRKTDSHEPPMSTVQPSSRSACTVSLLSASRTSQSVRSVSENGCLHGGIQVNAALSPSPPPTHPHTVASTLPTSHPSIWPGTFDNTSPVRLE